MATKKLTITVDEEVLKNFKEIADSKGIKISSWVTLKMKEFIKEGDC